MNVSDLKEVRNIETSPCTVPSQEDSALVAGIIPPGIGKEMAVKAREMG